MCTRLFGKSWTIALLLFIATCFGCSSDNKNTVENSSPPVQSSTQSATNTSPASSSKVEEMANDVTKGVGAVQKTAATEGKGPVFVFEEVHTSRVGQLEIAVMLLRLHEKYGLKKIGLEGSVYSGKALDASWFHNMGGASSKSDREALGVRWLAEGEISSPEFMTLLFPEVQVYGIESAQEYETNLDAKTSPEAEYLLAIAEKSLTDDDKVKVMTMIQQGKKKEAFEHILNADPWVKNQYENLKKHNITSSEAEIARARELQNKASQVGAQVSPQASADLEKEIKFYETASKRSNTMVDHLLELPGMDAGTPSAMIIGAAHTERVVDLLTQQKVAFAVIRPVDLNTEKGSLTGEQFDRKSHGMWAHNSPGTLGQVLNGSRKPSPIIERATGHAYASMNMAAIWFGRYARAAGGGSGGGGGGGNKTTTAVPGGFPPDDLWAKLSELPDIRFDRRSIFIDGYDVTYKAWLKQDNGMEKEVWGHVGTVTPQAAEKSLTVEQQLLQRAAELKGESGTLAKESTPPGVQAADDEGPRDRKSKGVIISRTSMDTLAVFGSTQASVQSVGRVSD
jgi:hypothetical protein